MSEPRHGTIHAEQRIRTLLAELGPDVHNLGSGPLYSDAFRSGEWPRGVYALDRTDLEAVLALLDRARTLRLARPSAAVDPEVHAPQRVRAYLAAGGWEVAEGGRVAELWRLAAAPDRQLLVPLIPTSANYAKALGALAAELADRYSVGELRVLAEIAACDG
jgi:hypothetical protein